MITRTRMLDNPFLTNPKERLSRWKDLRLRLGAEMTDAEQLEAVAVFWSHAPIKQPFMDYLTPSAWPDGWEIMDSCDMDQNMVALGMYHTLVLASDGRWSNRLRLLMIRIPSESLERLVLVVDGKACLNLWHGAVCEWPPNDDVRIMHIYAQDGSRRMSMKDVDNEAIMDVSC